MTIQEIEQKKQYLIQLRSFTLNELKMINHNLIKLNIHNNPSSQELLGISKVYAYIESIIREESTFPYPK